VYGGELVRLRDGLIIEHQNTYTKPRLELTMRLGVLNQEKLAVYRARQLV